MLGKVLDVTLLENKDTKERVINVNKKATHL